MEKVKLSIEGMSCGSCVKHVTEALSFLAGVTVERVMIGTAEVSLDPSKTTPLTIMEALAAAGYPARAERATVSTDPCAMTDVSKPGSCSCCRTS